MVLLVSVVYYTLRLNVRTVSVSKDVALEDSLVTQLLSGEDKLPGYDTLAGCY